MSNYMMLTSIYIGNNKIQNHDNTFPEMITNSSISIKLMTIINGLFTHYHVAKMIILVNI